MLDAILITISGIKVYSVPRVIMAKSNAPEKSLERKNLRHSKIIDLKPFSVDLKTKIRFVINAKRTEIIHEIIVASCTLNCRGRNMSI